MPDYGHLSLSCAKIERPSPLQKSSCKVRLFAQNHFHANIAKKLPPQRCFKPLLIPIFNFSHKRPTFAFAGESGYTLGFANKIAHKGTHGETGGVSGGGGITTLGPFRTVRKPCVAGYQNGKLCRFWALAGCTLRRTQKAFGTAMRLCASLFRGVAAPLGCAVLVPLFVQYDLEGWKDLTKRSGRVTITRNNRTTSRLALVWKPRWAVK